MYQGISGLVACRRPWSVFAMHLGQNSHTARLRPSGFHFLTRGGPHSVQACFAPHSRYQRQTLARFCFGRVGVHPRAGLGHHAMRT